MQSKLLKVIFIMFILGPVTWGVLQLPAPVYAAVNHCGTLSGDETWLARDNVHVVTCDTVVPSGATLTIEAGTIIKFHVNTRLIVQGTLDARGTAGNEIVFTSLNDDAHGGDTDNDGTASAPQANDWGWVQFDDSSNDASRVEYAVVSYGGKDYWSRSNRYYGGVRLIGASPTISNSTFSNNGNYAIGADVGSFPTVSGNTMTNNGTNGIGLYGGTITANDGKWTSTDAVYVLHDDIVVGDGRKLTISPGAIIKGKVNTRLIVQGTLDARGRAGNQIVFTSINDDAHGGDTDNDGAASAPRPNDWGWVQFDHMSNDASTLEYCQVSYGGKDYWSRSNRYYGAAWLLGASPTISSCTFSYNGNYAIGTDVGSFPTVSGNTMTNNGTNGIGLYAGTITANNGKWTSTDSVYVLDGDITVGDGRQLTINPGVIVKGKTNTRLIVQGTLDARGAVGNQIVFTSINDDAHGGDTDNDGTASAPRPNDWGWVQFDYMSNDASRIEHAVISYGGKDYWSRSNRYYGAVWLLGTSPTISNSTFSYNGNYAIGADVGSFPTVSGNTMSNNGTNGIGLYAGTITANDGKWTSTDAVYVLDGDIVVGDGKQLTIDPGVIVKGKTNTRLIVQGTLDARGRAGNKIVFTSINDDAHGGDTDNDGTTSAPQANDWGWVQFDGISNDVSTLEYCQVSYGGKDYWSRSNRYYGAVWLLGASPTINNCTFSYNGNYAIGADVGSFPTVSGNTMTSNGTNGIGLYAGTITANNGRWTSTDAVYVLDGNIVVGDGKQLTISPGVIVKGKINTRLIVQGTLDARGTLNEQIVFTSINDDAHGGDTDNDGTTSAPQANDWGWVQFDDISNDASRIEYALVSYGGKSYWSYGNRYYGGVWLVGASPTLLYNTLVNNHRGIYLQNDSLPTLTCNDIYNNAVLGVLNTTPATVVRAEGHWWGAASGPTHAGNPSGTGQAVSDGVDYAPWASQSCLLPPPPAAPTGLTITEKTNTSVTFTWDAHPDFVTGWGYKVYYDTDSSQPPFNGSGLTEGPSPIAVGDVTQYTLTGLDPAQSYHIALTVVDDGGTESVYSQVVIAPGNTLSLQVAPNSLDFKATLSGSNPAGQTITISKIGNDPLNWTATEDISWLNLSATSGTAPATVTASANINGLDAGDYVGQITIDGGTALNSPQVVNVTLKVEPPPPPNDPLLSQQWWLSKVKAQMGWAQTPGSSEVVIAVIDSGVDYTHVDLGGGKSLTDKDKDYVNNDDDAQDDNGHGTHVAGIAAAKMNNGQGIAGICPNCRILPVKTQGAGGQGSFGDVSAAIRYSADAGASVINMSLGAQVCTAELAEAVNYAYDKGVVMVAAAGNACPVRVALGVESFDVNYPARFGRVIAVGATTPSDQRANFSSFGPELDIAAPGTSILSTYPNNGYKRLDGTSMASPIVAGASGLLLSKDSSLTPAQVQQILETSADDIAGTGWDETTGWGRLNLQSALQTSVGSIPAAPPVVCTAVTTQNAPRTPEDDLITLYQNLRDEVLLQSELGQIYVRDFYHHTPEMGAILFTNSDLRDRSAQFLRNASDEFGSLLPNSVDDVTLSDELYQEADGLIRDLAAQSSNELGSRLLTVWDDLALDSHIGQPATQIWEEVQEAQAEKKVYLPILLR